MILIVHNSRRLEVKKKTNSVDMTNLLNPFWNTGLYLAAAKGYERIVGVGHTMEQALENAKRSGYDDPIILRAMGDAALNRLCF